MTHDTNDEPSDLLNMGFGVVVCYMGSLFGRVHRGLKFYFQLLYFILLSFMSKGPGNPKT